MKILFITICVILGAPFISGSKHKTRLRKFEPGVLNAAKFHPMNNNGGYNTKVISFGDEDSLKASKYSVVSKPMGEVVFTKAVHSEEGIPKHEAFLNVGN